MCSRLSGAGLGAKRGETKSEQNQGDQIIFPFVSEAKRGVRVGGGNKEGTKIISRCGNLVQPGGQRGELQVSEMPMLGCPPASLGVGCGCGL